MTPKCMKYVVETLPEERSIRFLIYAIIFVL